MAPLEKSVSNLLADYDKAPIDANNVALEKRCRQAVRNARITACEAFFVETLTKPASRKRKADLRARLASMGKRGVDPALILEAIYKRVEVDISQ